MRRAPPRAPLGRHGAGGAEIGRAEDRHVGDDAGIVDQIADAHEIAGDGRFGLERGTPCSSGGEPFAPRRRR